jgi:hypothetical protein
MVERLSEIKAILRDCLDRLGVEVKQPVEMKPETVQTEVEFKNKVGDDSEFNNNPWVQIFRAKSRG